MHNIHKVTYPENVNKKSVQQEWDNAAACAGKEEGASGLDKDIQWYDHICDNYEEAEEFITQHDSGWYDQLAVKYLTYPELSSKKMTDMKNRLEKAKARLDELNGFHFANAKSQYVGCKKCGSKLSLRYMKSNYCPLCKADLRPESKLASIKSVEDKIYKLALDIGKEERLLQKKSKAKSTVRWLVKVEYHS